MGEFVVILGMGVSGIAAAKLLKRQGYDVFISETKPSRDMAPNIQELEKHGIEFECGQHTLSCIQKAGFVVKSPGILSNIMPLDCAQKIHVPVYSEIEVASWFCRAPIIAITGTNGKTTTTRLIGRMIQEAHSGTIIGGNIGTPFADFADRLKPSDYAVLEVSSFQLENIKQFCPKIAMILNVSPNHLDHHLSYDDYVTSKMRIMENQTAFDYLVYNADDPVIRESVSRVKSIHIPFSLNQKPPFVHVYVENGILYFMENNSVQKLLNLDQTQLKGQHNISNILAAVSAARLLNISSATIRKVLMEFTPLEHRLEFVAEINHVQFYNDSKSTTTVSTKYALQSFAKPVILLAGGKAKEKDYSLVLKDIQEKATAVCLFGESRQKIARDLNSFEHIASFPDLNGAFRHAVSIARPGEVILLSPMCASLDQYKNFEQRGKEFKLLVADYMERLKNESEH